jgi:large subunit ribosomal protein L21
MYAIITTGGKQYRVETGTELDVEKLDAVVGAEVKLPAIAVFGDGDVKTNATAVKAKVIEHGKGDKIRIFTYKPKKNERKRKGHRQPYTRIKITSI